MSSVSSIFRQADVRGQIYGLFSLIFRYRPTIQLIELLKQDEILDAMVSFPGMQDEVEQLRHLFDAGNIQELNQILGVAYTRLFITPGTRIIPYQSAYSGNMLLWGPQTLDVMGYYNRTGFAVPDSEIPDHIGVELGFMQYLCTAQQQDDIELFRIETEFFNKHLLTWAPLLFRDVHKSSTNVFYRIMAALAARFIEMAAQDIYNVKKK